MGKTVIEGNSHHGPSGRDVHLAVYTVLNAAGPVEVKQLELDEAVATAVAQRFGPFADAAFRSKFWRRFLNSTSTCSSVPIAVHALSCLKEQLVQEDGELGP